MRIGPTVQCVVLAFSLCAGASMAADAVEGAMLHVRTATRTIEPDGVVDRNGLESAVLVSFGETFTMQKRGLRLELVATDLGSAADVQVTIYDARNRALVLVGTKQLNVPAGDLRTMRLTGTDGTAYDVSVQFSRAPLPAAKP